MPNTLELTSELVRGKYTLKARVGDGSEVSKDIFLHERKEDGSLGEYQTLCYLDELGKYPLYNPNKPASGFGSRLVRHSEMSVAYDSKEQLLRTMETMKKSFKALVHQSTEQRGPVVEVFSV